ncbi:Protein of unknown function [Pseudomonas sp. ok272]|uniref:bestrophin-like domain n=1 Tax=unclassified Pseudomonas TaxID=196821 RepID=UPI0008BF910D|nr:MULTISPECIES: DUF4239 domain-containing protein [unclassified Pseudomonas]SEN20820.1 Protein of unknown function [Pseudomonas sp. ok272]SFN12702.1 Protein of unknown function [Pseudomonas sp. ok602]
MSQLLLALIIFLCLFGSALLGAFVRAHLPDHHLSDDSISVIKLATGLIATMAALILGLLVSTAKGTFDTANAELVSTAAKVVQFDRVLARYGPETDLIRQQVKQRYGAVLLLLASREPALLSRLDNPQAIQQSEALLREVEALTPTNDSQRALKAQALQLMDEVFATRWLVLLQAHASIPPTMLVILVAWLSIIFGSFGLFAPRNATIVIVLMLCALSTSASILLVEELNRPLDGLISLSLSPMRDSLGRLGL